MICPRCGETNPAHAAYCVRCGCSADVPISPEQAYADRGGAVTDRQTKIPGYLWLSVLMLVICLPMGAAALVYSLRVEKYVMQQDYPAAREASYRARKISIIGILVMAAAAATYFLCMFALMLVVN